jgi:hypothetical protein
VDALANFPLSFPIYAGILSRTAAKLTYALNHGEESQPKRSGFSRLEALGSAS